MKTVETVAKTKEEAVQEALRQLGTTIENVTVEYEEQKSGGFLGFLAKTEYRVKVTLIGEPGGEPKTISIENKEETVETFDAEETTHVPARELTAIDFENAQKKATKFIEDVFESIGIKNVDITSEIKEDSVEIKVIGDEASRLIGRRGESLDSLQMLMSLAVNRGTGVYVRVLLDIENYRSKREESLKKYALKMARQATKQKRLVKLEPMNPYERRIVHASLKEDRYVKTYSEGKDPYRRVVIEPKYRY